MKDKNYYYFTPGWHTNDDDDDDHVDTILLLLFTVSPKQRWTRYKGSSGKYAKGRPEDFVKLSKKCHHFEKNFDFKQTFCIFEHIN